MSSCLDNVFHQEFLKELDTKHNGIYLMQQSRESSEESTIKLNIRLHKDGDEKSYLVGLLNPYGVPHSETGVKVMEAGPFKHRLNLDRATPQYDEHYLGPFDQEQTLMIMGAAEYMAFKCGLDEQIEKLAKYSDMYDKLTDACSEKFNMLCAAERDEKRETLKNQLKVLPGGKKDGPGPT